MARRIRRIKKISHSKRVVKQDSARPEPGLPEARVATTTRVLISAPGPVRTILASRISGSDEIELAGVAENESAAVEKILTEDADVAVIYIHQGEILNGLDIARNVSQASPDAGILMLVDELEGIDVRRHSRRFGTAWSYAAADGVKNSGERFLQIVQSVGRGIQWIDPDLKPVLEAIWRVAEQGRDMDASATAEKMALGEAGAMPPQRPDGIQTMQAGNSGVGNSGFGVRKAG